jgi:hypothetical protein
METIELGGNITLTGFSQLEFTELIVVKKMVGQYARKLSDANAGFTKLTLTRKEVHGTQVELIAKATVDSQEYASESTGHNLFVVLDDVLKRVQEQIRHHEKK